MLPSWHFRQRPNPTIRAPQLPSNSSQSTGRRCTVAAEPRHCRWWPHHAPMPAAMDSPEALALLAKVADQGGVVRDVKAKVKAGDADAAEADAALQQLFALKAEFKELTGQDVPAPKKQSSKKDKKKAKEQAPAAAPAAAEPSDKAKAKAAKKAEKEAAKAARKAENAARLVSRCWRGMCRWSLVVGHFGRHGSSATPPHPRTGADAFAGSTTGSGARSGTSNRLAVCMCVRGKGACIPPWRASSAIAAHLSCLQDTSSDRYGPAPLVQSATRSGAVYDKVQDLVASRSGTRVRLRCRVHAIRATGTLPARRPLTRSSDLPPLLASSLVAETPPE